MVQGLPLASAGSVVPSDGLFSGSDMVEIDPSHFPKFCFQMTLGMKDSKPKCIAPIHSVYKALITLLQKGNISLSILSDISYPPQGSSADKAALMDLSSRNFHAMWPQFKDCLYNKGF